MPTARSAREVSWIPVVPRRWCIPLPTSHVPSLQSGMFRSPRQQRGWFQGRRPVLVLERVPPALLLALRQSPYPAAFFVRARGEGGKRASLSHFLLLHLSHPSLQKLAQSTVLMVTVAVLLTSSQLSLQPPEIPDTS